MLEPVLICRDRELERLRELIDAGLAGRGAAVVLEGEPGIGKTTLLAELARTAATPVLHVGAAAPPPPPSLPAPPFAALRALLQAAAADHEALPATQRLALASAFALEPPSAEARFALLAGVVALLRSAAPVLVLVDDLQWLDAPSADAILFAARRLRDAPVAFVLAARRGTPAVDRCGLERLVVGPPDAAVEAQGELVERLVAAGRHDEAEARAAGLAARAAASGSPVAAAIAWRCEVLVAPEAELAAVVAAARRCHDAIDLPFERARLELAIRRRQRRSPTLQ